jgi:hypothetical protein
MRVGALATGQRAQGCGAFFRNASGRRENPSFEEVKASASGHRALDEFKVIDLAFDLTLAPRQLKGGLHGIVILQGFVRSR